MVTFQLSQVEEDFKSLRALFQAQAGTCIQRETLLQFAIFVNILRIVPYILQSKTVKYYLTK